MRWRQQCCYFFCVWSRQAIPILYIPLKHVDSPFGSRTGCRCNNGNWDEVVSEVPSLPIRAYLTGDQKWNHNVLTFAYKVTASFTEIGVYIIPTSLSAATRVKRLDIRCHHEIRLPEWTHTASTRESYRSTWNSYNEVFFGKSLTPRRISLTNPRSPGERYGSRRCHDFHETVTGNCKKTAEICQEWSVSEIDLFGRIINRPGGRKRWWNLLYNQRGRFNRSLPYLSNLLSALDKRSLLT